MFILHLDAVDRFAIEVTILPAHFAGGKGYSHQPHGQTDSESEYTDEGVYGVFNELSDGDFEIVFDNHGIPRDLKSDSMLRSFSYGK